MSKEIQESQLSNIQPTQGIDLAQTAKRIANLRKENGLTQEQFAEELFVSRAAVSKWENGKGLPSLDTCQLMSEKFDISIDYILGTRKESLGHAIDGILRATRLPITTPVDRFFHRFGQLGLVVAPLVLLLSFIFVSTEALPWSAYQYFEIDTYMLAWLLVSFMFRAAPEQTEPAQDADGTAQVQVPEL